MTRETNKDCVTSTSFTTPRRFIGDLQLTLWRRRGGEGTAVHVTFTHTGGGGGAAAGNHLYLGLTLSKPMCVRPTIGNSKFCGCSLAIHCDLGGRVC